MSFCGELLTRVHSTYERIFQYLPIQGKKVITRLINRKMFCDSESCKHTIFAERFDFLAAKSKKDYSIRERNCTAVFKLQFYSSITNTKKNVVDVGKSIFCNLLKKEGLIIEKLNVTAVCIDDFGLKKDILMEQLHTINNIDAFKNAIKYEYSNGLAEGSVNKLKAIKRIMYGLCSFETLRIKTLIFNINHTKFAISITSLAVKIIIDDYPTSSWLKIRHHDHKLFYHFQSCTMHK